MYSKSLLSAREQKPDSKAFGGLENKTHFGVSAARKAAVDNDVSKHTDQVMFSCGSLAPKLRGGCTDHNFTRATEPWEASDGAIYLVRELAPVVPDMVAARLPALADLAVMNHFDHVFKLRETLWNCLPLIARPLGKQSFKAHVDLFLDPMFKDLKCDQQLCRCAAGKCIAAVRDWFGPSVFAGRLDEWQKSQLMMSRDIPEKLVWARGSEGGEEAVKVKEGTIKSTGVVARMRALPPGSAIPNLLG